ncbi:redox-active disulfide protein 2 [Lacrimispora amygdalina]|uniref:Redox-active disulfide protein 2 n=1 Tax=Lacrimispora amygdalina TaxID=253257 RepID=A0A3E2N7U8_9FIRM|nr:thioredoxin family protein [Clostridium indicum]RFZ76961.1 thioredoxin family protein [Clostridium indicum]
MALFGFGKKKEEEKEINSGVCCEGSCSCSDTMADNDETKINGASVKVLGSGCAKCNQLEAATREALKELGMESTIDHVTDFTQIAAYGVMSTPALVVDGKVVSFGKVLKKEEVVNILKNIRETSL